jgi:hypothetical protein
LERGLLETEMEMRGNTEIDVRIFFGYFLGLNYFIILIFLHDNGECLDA